MPAMPAARTVQLLPEDRQFSGLLLPYLTPYLVYVAISSVPTSVLAGELAQAVKLVATTAALLIFRKAYRFGSFQLRQAWLAGLWLPVALFAWIGPFYLLSALGLTDVIAAGNGAAKSISYFFLRLFNVVVLVTIFEELFMRVYVMGWLYQAGMQRQEKGWGGSLLDTLEQRPFALTRLPLSSFSVFGAALVFAAGHLPVEYPSAALYFLFTTWLYQKGGSLWVCIIIHGLTNLAIALLAQYGGMEWLWV